MNQIKNKVMKIGLLFVLALGLAVNLKPQDVSASLGNPVIEAYVMENGVSVPLGDRIATSTVTLKSNVPVIFYLYDNAITDTYTTYTTIQGGYSKDGFKYYGIDQAGRTSPQITVKMDYNQAPILTGIVSPAGLESVTLDAMKSSYFVVNGVKSSEMSIKKTFTERGDYTVYAESHDGLRSNVMTFSIPTKGVVTSATTTPKPIVTTTRRTTKGSQVTTTSVPGGIVLSLVNVDNGGSTNMDVVLEAKEDVFFIINGVKESKAVKTMTFTKEGSYTITAENAKKKSSDEVSFVIDKTSPELVIEMGGVEQSPGIFNEPVTIRSNEAGVFMVNGNETYGTNDAITISDNGTYTVEFFDNANNKTSVDFVLSIEKAEEPVKTKSDMSWMLYLVIGLVAGAGVALGGSYFLNKRK